MALISNGIFKKSISSRLICKIIIIIFAATLFQYKLVQAAGFISFCIESADYNEYTNYTFMAYKMSGKPFGEMNIYLTESNKEYTYDILHFLTNRPGISEKYEDVLQRGNVFILPIYTYLEQFDSASNTNKRWKYYMASGREPWFTESFLFIDIGNGTIERISIPENHRVLSPISDSSVLIATISTTLISNRIYKKRMPYYN